MNASPQPIVALLSAANYKFCKPYTVAKNLLSAGAGLGKFTKSRHKQLDPYMMSVASEFYPDVNKYVLPKSDPESTKSYLRIHCDSSNFVQLNISCQARDLADSLGVKILPLLDPQKVDLDFNLYSELASTVNGDATPGYPFYLKHALKSEVFERSNVELYSIVASRLRMLASLPHSYVSTLNARQIVSLGLADPKYVITKSDPTSATKTARVIQAASSADELVSKALYYPVHKYVLTDKGKNFSLLGTSFEGPDVHMLHRFADELRESEGLAATDCDKYEFSHSGPTMVSERSFYIQLYDCEDTPLENAILNQAYCEMFTVFIFADGELYEQVEPAQEKSGVPGTSTDNTVTRRCIYSVASGRPIVRGVRDCLSSSDDALERKFPDARRRYAALGYSVRGLDDDTSESFECCSHFWERGKNPVAQNVAKSLCRYISQPSPQAALDFEALHHRDERAMTALTILLLCPREGSEQT
jgi:hypothetical protein